jgi:hypothetical protein
MGIDRGRTWMRRALWVTLALLPTSSALAVMPPATYHAAVRGNTVIICPRLLNERACPQPEGMLRQEVASGRVERIADLCTDERPLPPGVIAEAPAHARRACYLDECVPPGRYRYGYARPLQCMGSGSQYHADEVTVTEPLPPTCARRGAPPQPVERAPWGNAPWICHRGCMGCAVAAPEPVPRGLIGLGLAIGLLLLAARARRHI